MTLLLTLLLLLVLFTFLVLSQAKFGKLPTGARLETIKKSPNYQNGAFQNQSETPTFTNGATYFSILKEFFFGKNRRAEPFGEIPSIKTDLMALDLNEDALVWFGHSSYYLQIDGKRILVDPVFSGAASPFSFSVKAFPGTDRYTPDDVPNIDYLFLTHDHWDHLDHDTIVRLKPKIGRVVCGLGTGQHLEHWGFEANKIVEKDWNETVNLEKGFTVHTTPARHFSGRGLKRNQALWTSFVLQTPTMQLFLGGDSGYDNHFAEIGKTFGPFDLAILENGQYNKNWQNIHLMPHEILQAAKDLHAKRIFPVHSSKFALGNHAWDEPLELISQNNTSENLNIITPMIGEMVRLKDPEQAFTAWWKNVS
ncbi:MAG: MBL fold metallo-hydrolase [Saprospiraceae bacterium]|nr:MBL fold metallo-hydrolase [Saprospiraceae bacterium]